MARSTFGGYGGDQVAQDPTGNSGFYKSAASLPATGTFWSAQTGGTQYTDLIDPITSVALTGISTDTRGHIVLFKGPDGVVEGWVDFGAGRFKVVANDLTTSLDVRYAGLPASPAAFNLLSRDSTNTSMAWTTSHASVARALGWELMADPANGGVADCNGTQGNGTDNLAAFNTAAAKGKPVYFGPGTWRMSGQMAGASVYGAGGGHPAVAGSAKTTIVFDSGVSGVKLNQIAAHLENVYLVGGGGTTADGIKIENSWTVVRDVSVKGFSRHGYNLDSSSPVGVFDQAQVQTLHVYNCGGNGHNVVGGADSNACTFTAVDCVGNTGWGIWSAGTARNIWIGGHLSQNTAGGIHDDGNSNKYHVYIEGGTGNTLDFGSTSSNGIYEGMAYAMPTLTGSLSAAIQTWEIHKGGALKGQMLVEDQGAALTTRWGWRVGNFGAGWLEIFQATSGTRLLRVDSTLAASYWNTHFDPETTATFDFGSASQRWRHLYLSGNVVQVPTAQTLASNGAVTITAASGDAAITLQANATSSTISGGTSGAKLTITWIQDATGGRTYVWPTNCKFAGGTAPSDTTASKRTSVSFQFDGTNWYEQARAVAVG